MADFEYDILKHYGTLGEDRAGWKTELNLVSWNRRQPKFDLRSWAPGHEKAGKGVTLTRDEAAALIDLLQEALEGKDAG